MTTEASTAEDAARLDAAAQTLARLSRHLEHALHGEDLTLPQFRLLLFLEKSPDAASRLAAKLHVRPPSLTALVDGMVARGLVDRTADAVDRRRVSIAITAAGRSKLDVANAAARRRLSAIEALDPTRSDLAEGLSGWHDALGAARQQRLDQ